MRLTYQLHNDQVLTHSVVGAALSSDGTMGIGVRHGWRRVGEPVLVTQSSNNRVYFVGGADFDDGSLGLIAEVPQGGLAWFMEGDEDSVLAATDAACADALAPLQGRPPLGAFAFDCVARRGILGDAGIAAEVERVARSTGGAPVSGFYTYGEIARTRGLSGFHNQTLVVLAMG